MQQHWPDHDRDRRDYQNTVYDVLIDDWAGVLKAYMERSGMDPVQLAMMGEPDTSDNLLGQVTAGLTTPGRYGHRPTIRHPSPLANWLIGDGKALDRAFWAPVMQTVERHAFASGDCLLHLEVTTGPREEGGGLPVLTPVYAHQAWAVPYAHDPSRARVIGWARVLEARGYVAENKPLVMHVYRVWELPEYEGDEPRYRIVAAQDVAGVVQLGAGTPAFNIRAGDDVTPIFADHGPLVGDAYPWRYSGGQAFIPIAWYRSQYTGALWSSYARRGAFLATMQIGMVGTAIRASVQASSGQVVLAWGLSPPASNVAYAGERGTAQSVSLTPGTMLFLVPDAAASDKQISPAAQVINPGGNLQQLTQYLAQVREQVAANLGLSGGAVTRNSANPTSAAALTISDAGRREHMAIVEPLYRAADLEMLRKVAALSNLWGATHDQPWQPIPEDGYTIEYYSLPADPNTERATRESDDWELGKGLVSAVDLWLKRNPGASYDDAVAALVKVEVDRVRVAQATASALGLPAPMTPSTPEREEADAAPEPPDTDGGELGEEDEDTDERAMMERIGPLFADALDDAGDILEDEEAGPEDLRDVLRRLVEAAGA